MGRREREGEREREAETDRHTDRKRQRNRQTERKSNRVCVRVCVYIMKMETEIGSNATCRIFLPKTVLSGSLVSKLIHIIQTDR